MKPTKDTYMQLDKAFSHFNRTLFHGKLPHCMIMMQRKKHAYGYFLGNAWREISDGSITDEIALNPESFQSRELDKILSTLVHEMCHLQQHHYGKPSRNGYHNKEWAHFMETVGLIPSDTGQKGGKRTGQHMTHYIERGEIFEKSCSNLLKNGFSITWQANTKETGPKKTKYRCSVCGLNAWGKPKIILKCGTCNEFMKSQY